MLGVGGMLAWGPLRRTIGEAPGYGGRFKLYLSANTGGMNRPPKVEINVVLIIQK